MADLMTQILASIYLGPPGVAIWRWSEDEQAIVWPDGTTIVLRRELEEVLTRLAPQGLPSLSAVVLVLGACREGWEEAAGTAFERLRQAVAGEPAPTPTVLERRLKAMRHALDPLSRLAPRLRQGPDAKAALVELVLESAPRDLDPAESAAVLVTLREEHVSPASAFPATGLEELLKDLEVVARGAAGLDPERLALRARTGLEALPHPGAVELPDPEKVRQLLAELASDRELSGLARLAQDLLAAVHVPRRLSEQEDQALGGVSDLSNRGPPERLLLSELAHDDLTLAVRLALGEALYLRREAPPRRPAGVRALLLDCGIRLWGAPRLFAAAVGLALTAEAGPATRVRAWRPARSGVQPVELTSREGLVEHLEALEPGPHPGPSLQALLHRLAAEEEGSAQELLLVTHAAVLEDPGFQAELTQLQREGALGERPLLVASVDGAGNYRLQALGRRGRRLLGQARLELAKLHPAPPAAPLLVTSPPENELPLLLRQETLPLLLPHRLDPARTAWHPLHGLVCATRDGRLTRWDRPGMGGRQLTDRLPEGRVVWIELDEEGVARCLLDAASRGTHVLQARPDEELRRVRPFRPGEQQLLGAVRLPGGLALVLSRAVHLIEPDSGATVATLRLTPGTHWSRGRFFRSPLGWRALRFDGRELELVALDGVAPVVTAVWERRGVDGLTLLRSDGTLEHRHPDRAPSQHPLNLGRTGWTVRGVSGDGRLVRIARLDEADLVVALSPDPVAPSLATVPDQGELALCPELAEFSVGLPQLRRRFLSVGADAQGRLVLESRRGAAWPVFLGPDGQLRLGPEDSTRQVTRAPLVEHPGPSGVSYPVRVASFRDGSRVFVDGRGLVHLKSPRLPVELALVIPDEGPLAAWASDGHVCGRIFFLGEVAAGAPGDQIPAATIARHLATFAGGLP